MSVLSPALLGATALVLLASGLLHARHPGVLARGLAAHAVLPRRARSLVGLGVPVLEVVLGAATVVTLAGWGWSGLTGDARTAQLAVGLGTAALFAGFAAYLLTVSRAQPDADLPCACGIGETSVGTAALTRAAGLALLGALGGLTAQGWQAGARPLEESAVVAAAAVTLAITVSLLPAARELPDGLTRTVAPAPSGVLR